MKNHEPQDDRRTAWAEQTVQSGEGASPAFAFVMLPTIPTMGFCGMFMPIVQQMLYVFASQQVTHRHDANPPFANQHIASQPFGNQPFTAQQSFARHQAADFSATSYQSSSLYLNEGTHHLN
jgi:hypothetical protein